jgi:hypothetical protein
VGLCSLFCSYIYLFIQNKISKICFLLHVYTIQINNSALFSRDCVDLVCVLVIHSGCGEFFGLICGVN